MTMTDHYNSIIDQPRSTSAGRTLDKITMSTTGGRVAATTTTLSLATAEAVASPSRRPKDSSSTARATATFLVDAMVRKRSKEQEDAGRQALRGSQTHRLRSSARTRVRRKEQIHARLPARRLRNSKSTVTGRQSLTLFSSYFQKTATANVAAVKRYDECSIQLEQGLLDFERELFLRRVSVLWQTV